MILLFDVCEFEKGFFQRVGAGSELIQNDTQGSRERSDLLDKDPASMRSLLTAHRCACSRQGRALLVDLRSADFVEPDRRLLAIRGISDQPTVVYHDDSSASS